MIYSGKKLNEIRFPLGGIGTGSISIAGNGALTDWEIFNRANKGGYNDHSFFAVKAEYPDGQTVVKVLQGDQTQELHGQYKMFYGHGFGPRGARMFGFPHFKKVRFDGKFPIATITFEDDAFPGKVVLRAFNPFIPLNEDDSGLPAAFFEIEVKSPCDGVRYTALMCVQNPLENTVNKAISLDGCTAIQMKNADLAADDVKYADLTLAVQGDGFYQEYGYRGKYRDMITTLWHDLTCGTLENRSYEEPGNADPCLVGAVRTLAAGEKGNFRFLLTWNVPNCEVYWSPQRAPGVTWKNYYATQFYDSAATCAYAMKHWERLYGQTRAFCSSLHSSTLDKAVIDAVSANLAVLKSPTVLRLEDGTFYGWEGLFEDTGSCEGTCVHVWNYVYSTCFLFPRLEQNLRTSELKYSMDEAGCLQYRSKLPFGKTEPFKLPPCLDGQMGTIIKIYRDWKISGDTDWLKAHWPKVKKLMDYAWSPENDNEWDRNKDGVLEGRQHHTLDVPLFGPSAWLEGMYLTALKAAAELAAAMGEEDKRTEYLALFEKGYAWTKENLFNGEWFIHKLDVTDKSILEHHGQMEYWNEERGQIKYQIGEGCQIDQLLGQWHANLCGLGDIFDKEQRLTALASLMKHNFKPSLREFVNPWRLFALNDEAGTIICDYPEGCNKPIIPISYVGECMTGFEYALAGLMISEGMIEQGLTLVRAIRDRHDGEKRNPWNEFECGNNYARSMASFALLPIFSGFTYDIPRRSIGFAPIQNGDFRAFWSLGTGWGDYIRKGDTHTIRLQAGSLTLERIKLGGIGVVTQILVDGKPVPFAQNGDELQFEPITVKRSIKIC